MDSVKSDEILLTIEKEQSKLGIIIYIIMHDHYDQPQ